MCFISTLDHGYITWCLKRSCVFSSWIASEYKECSCFTIATWSLLWSMKLSSPLTQGGLKVVLANVITGPEPKSSDGLYFWASLIAQWVKNLPTMQELQEMWARSLGWEDPPEKEMATHSSIVAWKIPWTEVPGGLQTMESERVGHDLATKPPITTFDTRNGKDTLIL